MVYSIEIIMHYIIIIIYGNRNHSSSVIKWFELNRFVMHGNPLITATVKFKSLQFRERRTKIEFNSTTFSTIAMHFNLRKIRVSVPHLSIENYWMDRWIKKKILSFSFYFFWSVIWVCTLQTEHEGKGENGTYCLKWIEIDFFFSTWNPNVKSKKV